MDAELRAEIGREMDRIEALIHDLRAENERLRGKLEWIGMSSECQWTQAVAKEALK